MSKPRKPRKPKVVPSTGPPKVDGVTWSADIPVDGLRWLVPGIIPRGSLVLLEGRKAVGKSTIMAAVAAAMTGGRAMPGWQPTESRSVIWDAREDPWPSVVIPRLIAAGANHGSVGRLEPTDAKGRRRRLKLPGDILVLEECIRAAGVGLLVLDPFAGAADAQIDLRIEQQARAYLEPLLAVASDLDCLVLMSRHLRKGTGGDIREAGLGSVAVANVARVILRCDEHPHQPGDFVLSVVAGNHAKRAASQVYRIVDGTGGNPCIEWREQCSLDAESIAEGRGSEAERDEWSEADRLLYAVIGDIEVEFQVIAAEAERAGITPKMLRRAKARLGVQSLRIVTGDSACWKWKKPLAGWPVGLKNGSEH